MSKIQREQVVIEDLFYKFEETFNEVMGKFDNKRVISMHVLSMDVTMSRKKEMYLVIYEECEEESEDDVIEEGDLVFSHDINTGARIYETVVKVIFEDGVDKCYTIEEDNTTEMGWHHLNDVTLVAKKKDRKDK